MSSLSLRLPNSLHKRLSEWAKRENVSMNQFISSAVAEKVSSLMTVEYLKARGARGSRKRFEAVLAKVPALEPEPMDRLPARKSRRPKRNPSKRHHNL